MLLALLVAVSLPPAEVNHFAARVAQAVAQRLAPASSFPEPYGMRFGRRSWR